MEKCRVVVWHNFGCCCVRRIRRLQLFFVIQCLRIAIPFFFRTSCCCHCFVCLCEWLLVHSPIFRNQWNHIFFCVVQTLWRHLFSVSFCFLSFFFVKFPLFVLVLCIWRLKYLRPIDRWLRHFKYFRSIHWETIVEWFHHDFCYCPNTLARSNTISYDDRTNMSIFVDLPTFNGVLPRYNRLLGRSSVHFISFFPVIWFTDTRKSSFICQVNACPFVQCPQPIVCHENRIVIGCICVVH